MSEQQTTRQGLRNVARRVAAYGSLFVFLGALAALVVLRAGRPLWYATGASTEHALSLRNASMLVWQSPEPRLELPAGVHGRIARAPDGRYVVSRACGEPRGSEHELVLWDPERPEIEPELLLEIDGPGHDLAPAYSPADARLYFASDRPGGLEGFDLWSARWTGRGFAEAERLSDAINSEVDESDPAPHPSEASLVFIRRDPGVARGAHGVLMRALLGTSEAEVQRVFEDKGSDGPMPRFFDRDCIFDPTGRSLWFVRRFEDGRRQLMRSWRAPLGPVTDSAPRLDFVEPLRVPGIGALASMRGPLVSADGHSLSLVDDKSGLLRVSESREVMPWWIGQRDLEIVIALLGGIAALLFLLLWLGGRWRTLDIITQCLLLSLLVHLVLLLWFMRVQIVRNFIPPVPEIGDSVEVRLLSDSELDGGRAPDDAPSQESFDISRAQRFRGFRRELSERSPEQARLQADGLAARAAPDADRRDFAQAREELRQESQVQDAAAEPVRRAGSDQVARAEARTTSARKRAAVADARPERAAAQSRLENAQPRAETQAPLPRRSATAALPDASRAREAQRAPSISEARVSEARLAAASAPEPRAPSRSGSDARGPSPERRATSRELLAAAPGAPAPRQDVVRQLRQAPGIEAPRASLPRASGARRLTAAEQRRDSAARIAARAMPARERALRDAVRASSMRPAGRDEVARLRSGEVEATQADGAVASANARAAQPARKRSRDEIGNLAKPSTRLMRPGSARRGPAASARDPQPMRVARRFDSVTASARRAEEALRARARPKAKIARDAASARGDERAGPLLAKSTEIEARSSRAATATPSRRLNARAARARATEVAPPSFSLRRSRRARGTRARRDASIASGARSLATRDVSVRDRVTTAARASTTRRAKTERRRAPQIASRALRVALREDVLRAPKRRRGDAPKPLGSLRPPATRLARAPRVRRTTAVKERRGVEEPVRPELYANRFGEKKVEALEKFGGTKETEAAVQRGLAYLARIQRGDGAWGSPDDYDDKYGEVRVGKTGLCLLAFLGAGHLPPDDAAGDEVGRGKYARVAARSLDYLLASQDEESGHFGVTSAYGHGISTYAIAECYAITRMKRLREPLRRAIDWMLSQQIVGRARHSRGGWGYYSPVLRPEDRYARASVSSWQIMALESARRSGLDVPDRSLALAKRFLLQLFDERYRYFLYTREPRRLRMRWRTLPASTPASVFCLLLLGQKKTDPRIEAGLEFTTDRRMRRYGPASDDDFVMRGMGNPYFWYYGTLACFFRGDRAWKLWNEKLRVELPRGQSPDGSFAPVGAYAKYAKDSRRDRAYTTALCVLSLEVYYRYFTPLLDKQRVKIR